MRNVKIITPKRQNFLLLLTLVAVALISIGYAGLGQGGTAETTSSGNVSYTEQGADLAQNPIEPPKDNAEFFIEYRLERERTRGQQVEWLREITNNPNADAETRKKAQEQLYNLSQNVGKEMETENLIRAKGFNDAVVLLQHDKAVTVVVRVKELTPDDAAKIAELVARNTGVTPNNIIIIPKL
jgi:stage III sporulation protein AH